MQERKLYRKLPKYNITAVQLNLDFDELVYQKWGGKQTCKPGDWLINNDGDTYTIEKDYFIENYQRVSPGVFKKIGEVWAEVASQNGSLQTKEGSTDYSAGDYLVFDRREGGEGYAVKKLKFEKWYEEIDQNYQLTSEQLSYISDRIQPKIEEFKTKATQNQRQFYIWQAIAIIAAALVPVLSGFISDDTTFLKWIVALLGGTSAVTAGLLSLYKFQENWIRFRTTYYDLDSNLSQFKIGAGVYEDRNEAFDLLADNCESILKAEIGQWAESRKKE